MTSKSKYKSLVKENRGTIVALSLLSCLGVVLGVGFAYISKLVIEKLVEEHLNDNLVLVTVIAKSEASARLLECVDKFLC